MGLNVSVFVPEGIVIASDSLAFVRHDDEGYFSDSERTFVLMGRFIISFIGDGYIKGYSYGYHIENFLHSIQGIEIPSTEGFVQIFKLFIKGIDVDKNFSVYLAGFDENPDGYIQQLYLLERGNSILLNYADEKKILYNYHMIGQNLWCNKLMLPTFFTNGETKKEVFEAANIDFSKYSLRHACDFAKFLIHVVYEMDRFTQVRPSVSNIITVGVLSPLFGTKIYSDNI